MNYLSEEKGLHPRRGNVLKVLIVARISTVMQDRRSLDDQIALCTKWLTDHYSGRFDIEPITSQGSGEYLDTKELTRIESLLESRSIDVLIVEDLGRICRRSRAYTICELCLDMETRLVSINDHVDTSRDDWRLKAQFATMHHEISNQDTAARVRRSGDNRFRAGGSLSKLIYGYVKSKGMNDTELKKDPQAIEVYETLFSMIENGAGFADLSFWLNANKIPVGPCSKEKVWTSQMVGRTIRNTMLKGQRCRNRFVSKRINRTGRKRNVRSPESDLIYRDCPNLAFIEPHRYDRAIALLDKKYENVRGKYTNGKEHSRYLVSAKRTQWPGQHIRCGICGSPLHWTGSGKGKEFACSLALEYGCWNGTRARAYNVIPKLTAAIFEWIEKLLTPEQKCSVERDRRRRGKSAAHNCAVLFSGRGFVPSPGSRRHRGVLRYGTMG